MSSRYLILSSAFAVVCLTGSDLVGDAKKSRQKPSLAELKAVIQPMVASLELPAKQKSMADGVMSEDAWATILEGFKKKRGGEIFTAAHGKMREIVPTLMMPKMMKHNMGKIMQQRMNKKAGPPSQKDITAIREKSQKVMRGKLAPELMNSTDGLQELTGQRMEELLADKKVLVRVLGDKVSEVALLGDQKTKLGKAMADAGYPESLTHGSDPVLDKRMKTMLEAVIDKTIAELK